MKSGICPKCSSRNIIKFEPKAIVANRAEWDYEYLSTFTTIYSTRYVCVDCGYTERYFENKHLKKLQDKFKDN
ncbi:MAG: hypothetical protein ACI4TX_03605 [Christensenellales bacterium]